MPRTAPPVIHAVQRLLAWAREHQRLVDALFAALIALTEFTIVIGGRTSIDERAFDGWAIVLILIASCALIWRRSHPLAAMVVVFVAITPYYILNYGSFMSLAGITMAYSVAVHENNRRVAWIAVLSYSTVIFGVASFTLLNESEGFNTAGATSMFAYLVAGMVIGAIVRNRQLLFADSERRAEHAERDRLVEADRAVARERTRIAREMHDVVAHGMSVITVQAAAAQSVIHTDTDAVAEALKQIESVGRESLNEMRRMLSVLRGTHDENSAFSPQPHINDIAKLIERCVEAGIPTDLTVTGPQRELPAGPGLAAYRIVQESLTNIVKHAGTSAIAHVKLCYTDRSIEISITDDGRGAITTVHRQGGGNGLIGMRERVDVYSGEFAAGPAPGGGYSVHAVLPIEQASDRPGVAAAPNTDLAI